MGPNGIVFQGHNIRFQQREKRKLKNLWWKCKKKENTVRVLKPMVRKSSQHCSIHSNFKCLQGIQYILYYPCHIQKTYSQWPSESIKGNLNTLKVMICPESRAPRMCLPRSHNRKIPGMGCYLHCLWANLFFII